MIDETRLQDYLDGRMSESERTAFESAIARDPELAERVRSAKEIGRLLRSAPAALPDGFYERARARFEQRNAPPMTAGRRVSWELMGLAASILLVAVLVWYPGQRGAVPASSDETVFLQTHEAPQEKKETANAVSDDVAVPMDTERGALDRMRRNEPSAAPEYAPAPPPAAGGAAENESSRAAPAAKEARERDDAAGAPQPSSGDALGETSVASKAELARAAPKNKKASAPAGALANADARAAEPMPVVTPLAPRMARSVEVPKQVLSDYEISPIASETSDRWVALLAGPAAAEAVSLAPDFARERVVAIGARANPLSCSGISVRSTPTDVWITLRMDSRSVSAAPGGCLVVIPQGNQRVHIQTVAADPKP